MLVKPTVTELLDVVEDRYALVIITSKRARQLLEGAPKLVDENEASNVSMAADEVFAKKVYVKQD